MKGRKTERFVIRLDPRTAMDLQALADSQQAKRSKILRDLIRKEATIMAKDKEVPGGESTRHEARV